MACLPCLHKTAYEMKRKKKKEEEEEEEKKKEMEGWR